MCWKANEQELAQTKGKNRGHNTPRLDWLKRITHGPEQRTRLTAKKKSIRLSKILEKKFIAL